MVPHHGRDRCERSGAVGDGQCLGRGGDDQGVGNNQAEFMCGWESEGGSTELGGGDSGGVSAVLGGLFLRPQLLGDADGRGFRVQTSDGLLRNYITDSTSFEDASGSALMAATGL